MLLERLSHWWAIRRALGRLRALVARTDTPSPSDARALLALLTITQTKAMHWPVQWSPQWYRALVHSGSLLADNVASTSSVAGYPSEFVHEMVAMALKRHSVSLLDAFQKRLDARSLPNDVWAQLQEADPVLQVRFLTRLEHVVKLVGPQRACVMDILGKSDPHLWLYEHASWYIELASFWRMPPPVNWWIPLHTVDPYRPPNPLRRVTTQYAGASISHTIAIAGRTTYSFGQLELHRHRLLCQDPWAFLRSAFCGDPLVLSGLGMNNAWHQQRNIDACTIFRHYHPSKWSAKLQEQVPQDIRDGEPSVAVAMLLGMGSWQEAFQAFSSWLESNNGRLDAVQPQEELSLAGLV